MATTAYIALGSNLGDRKYHLDQAVERLRAHPGVDVTKVSKYRKTAPVGGPPGQEDYTNAVAEVQTDLAARELLRVLLGIEEELGRVREVMWGPRTMDLDLLLYGSEVLVIHEPGCDLVVPHPRMHERGFVLEPLAEVAPTAVHPVLQSTAADLNRRLHGFPAEPDLVGQTAVVTGSTSGIGRAIALELARAGAAVVVHGRRSTAAADEVAQECRRWHGWGHALLADLRDPAVCAELVENAWRWRDGIDIWVNNAGADTLTGDARHEPFEQKLEQLWQTDVRGTMLLSRDVGRRMKERGRGVILTIGWDQAETGMEGDSGELFAATKGAVMCFTRSLALSLAPAVRVNCLAPGWIKTAWGETASDAWQQRVLRETPLQRWGLPDDLAKAARWLASPAAAFFTGQTIRVNGGAVRA